MIHGVCELAMWCTQYWLSPIGPRFETCRLSQLVGEPWPRPVVDDGVPKMLRSFGPGVSGA